MTSIRHNPELVTDETAYLDAARDSILAVGWRRTTLTDVARRAGVSRMTIYRRWPDMDTLLRDLLVREWGGLVADALTRRGSIGDHVVAIAASLRDNALFRRVVEVDPDLLLPYVVERRGRNQEHLLDVLTTAIREGQRTGDIRRGDAALLARTVLLAAQGFVLSAATMSDVPTAKLDRELGRLIERYLAA
jgi:AcrR family transcriptional regulator